MKSSIELPMPGWFTPLVLILGLVALALFVSFWTTRKRKYAFGAAVALVLIVLVWLIASIIPTDRRAIEATMNDIMGGIRARNADGVFANLAKDFRYRTYDKTAFRQRVESHIRAGDAADIVSSGFEPDDISRSAKKAEVHFYVRSENVTGQRPFLVRAVFVLEDDGKWRLQKFGLYNPLVETNREIDIPGL